MALTIRNLSITVLLLAGLMLVPGAALGARDVYVIPVADAIGPGVADFIEKGIDTAVKADAACVVIELDTPGGLAESMRKIVMAMYSSTIPVVVFVWFLRRMSRRRAATAPPPTPTPAPEPAPVPDQPQDATD